MKISFVIPCRNNKKYFDWAYQSIRKNQGQHEVYICAADDASTDGTGEHFRMLAMHDPKFSYISNPGPERVGHTILYDRIINELVKTDIAIIFHCDMYLCPGALDEVETWLQPISYVVIDPFTPDGEVTAKGHTNRYKNIISLTRIEPPLHPDGPEKELYDWGVEPELFHEQQFLEWLTNNFKPKQKGYTTGVFAPWAFFVKDFKEIGGHDPLYRPQSKEDSDIFNRFKLNGVNFIQTWNGFVYHMTCRGSRFNPTLTTPGTNSVEWEQHNIRSIRNFIRKWGHFVQHTALMDPIIPPKYKVTFLLDNCTVEYLKLIEPWCDELCVKLTQHSIDQYIEDEQPNTDFDLKKKFVQPQGAPEWDPGIVVQLDMNKFTQEDFDIIQNLSALVRQTNKEGKYEIGNLKIFINDLTTYENELIKIDSNYYQSKLLK